MTTDNYIKDFINRHLSGIETIFKIKGNKSYSSLDEFTNSLIGDLLNEYNRILDKNLSSEEIDSHLFYLINTTCKNNPVKSNKTYICPGCLYFGINTVLHGNNYLKCSCCKDKLNLAKDEKEIIFYNLFSNHSAQGYRCKDCNRFIPKNNSQNITCPYFDCVFVGTSFDLKKMHHPSSLKEILEENKSNNTSSIKSKPDNRIKDIIEYQLNNLLYTNFNFTVKHKSLVYQAILNLLDRYPDEMTNYLLFQSRSGGFQHKIFQEYISLLEKSLPFVYKKNNKVFRVDSLLDNNLSLFDGISVFESVIDNNIIRNNTKEYYIGGRLAKHNKPYYIGKLLNIVDKNTKMSILDKVTEYSFSRIKLRDIVSGTPIIVTHLRVPPHYQMGGMVYVNRIRKKIVDALK